MAGRQRHRAGSSHRTANVLTPSRRPRAWLSGQNPDQGAYSAPPARRPAAPLCGAARRQDRGHQVAQRAGEVLLTHQDSAVTGVDDIDRAARSRPVRRGKARTCPIRVSQRPASVRPQVSSARRRMHPSHPISVTTTLTQPVSPRTPPAGSSWPRPCGQGRAGCIVPPARAPPAREQDQCANHRTGQAATNGAPLVTPGWHRPGQSARRQALLPSTAGTWYSTVHRSCPHGGGSAAAARACRPGRFARASRGHHHPPATGQERDLPYPADQGGAGADDGGCSQMRTRRRSCSYRRARTAPGRRRQGPR